MPLGRRGRPSPARPLLPPPRVWPFDLAWGTNLNLDSQVRRREKKGERRHASEARETSPRPPSLFSSSRPRPSSPPPPLSSHQQLAGDLFAASIFPYAAFLYFAHKSRKFPPLTLFGFYFLLAFVGGSIPAGIYAKTHYHDILANVDWLHGGAESLLTLTNLFIVLGLRAEIRKAEGERRQEE